MPFITDAVAGTDLLSVFVKSGSSPHTDPLAAYASWTSGMGGSDTTLARLIDGDSNVFTSIAGILNGGDTFGAVRPGSEGSFGVYLTYGGGSATTRSPLTAEVGSGQTSLTRFYAPSRAPSLIFTFSNPTADTERRDGKYRVSGGVAVFYVRWADSSFANNVEAALRLSPKRVEIVAQSNAGNSGTFLFQVFRAISTVVSPTTLPVITVGGNGAYTDTLVAGTTQHYLSEWVIPILLDAGCSVTTTVSAELTTGVAQPLFAQAASGVSSAATLTVSPPIALAATASASPAASANLTTFRFELGRAGPRMTVPREGS